MADETELGHTLKNQLAIILGYADLLLTELTADDPRKEDLQEIHKAASVAVALLDQHGVPPP